MHGWLLGNNSSVVVGDTQPVTSERRSADLRKHTDTRQKMEKQSTDTVSTAYLLPGLFFFYHTAEPYSIDYFKFK